MVFDSGIAPVNHEIQKIDEAIEKQLTKQLTKYSHLTNL